MTKLNDADAMFIGATPILAAHLGATQVWTPPGATGVFGETATGGGGNWPTNPDRAMFNGPWTVPTNCEVTSLLLNWRTGTVAGVDTKGLIYSNSGASGRPGVRLGVSNVALTLAGAHGLLLTFATPVALTAGQVVWLGAVCNESNGVMDSGAAVAGSSIMYNGDFSYAAPQNPAPTFSGSPGPYDNRLSLSANYIET